MNSPNNPNLRNHLLAISASLLIGAGLMALKFTAYYLTGSAAILSDALESIINVVAASFAMGSIIIAAKSPDPDHPYGHGKVEYFSAGFEGALIILAALAIFYEAWPRLLHPQAIPKLEKGTLLILGAALINLILGLVLVMVGRRTKSIVLIADGRHVLTDVYTTVGVVLGLVGVYFTGWNWLDGAVAFLVGLNILVTGARLVHQSAAGLMDKSDPELLEEICRVIADNAAPCGSTSINSGPGEPVPASSSTSTSSCPGIFPWKPATLRSNNWKPSSTIIFAGRRIFSSMPTPAWNRSAPSAAARPANIASPPRKCSASGGRTP